MFSYSEHEQDRISLLIIKIFDRMIQDGIGRRAEANSIHNDWTFSHICCLKLILIQSIMKIVAVYDWICEKESHPVLYICYNIQLSNVPFFYILESRFISIK